MPPASSDSPPVRDVYSAPVHVVGEGAASPLLLLADHASNAVPPDYGTLGLGEAAFSRHIAYDIGVGALVSALAGRLDATAVLGGFSRLLIDANRAPDDPTLVMKLSDGDIIPGNRHAGAAEIARRIAAYHAPYHRRITQLLDAALARGQTPLIISIHSFTPAWRGQVRPWHCGVLWDRDEATARPLLDGLRAMGDLTVGDNEPYTGRLEGDCMYTHGTARGIAHGLIEIRQDLIGDEAERADWLRRLTPILSSLRERICGQKEMEHG